ncbi:MAG TPA: NAD(P)/FAD-dependent oxidoreductase, partial [Chitinophagales bacterium]|nr:NAD(P)/FAD-dependent oxidoreductase [Chitinophagales bacterium]
MEKYDVIVIGSGPGGYVAAIRAAQLGKKTAIIEKYPTMGGTCLNVGCIPSKALLDSSENYYNTVNSIQDHGITVKDIKVDLGRIIERKGEVVKANTSGIEYLMKKNKITTYEGVASFEDTKKVAIALTDGKKTTIEGANIIIATGSKPSSLPFIKIDKKRVITSTEALNLEKIPKSLLVIGAGAIGLELGSVYARLGTEVTVVEYMDRVLPAMDQDLSKELQRVLRKQGLKFNLSHQLTEVKASKSKVTIKALDKKEKEVELEAEYCLVAVGRRPYTDGLGLEKIGI